MKRTLMKTTAQNHRSLRNRQRCWRPRWTSAQLRDGRRLTRRRMTKHSTPTLNPGGFIFCQQPLPHRRHPKAEKKIEPLNVLPEKRGSVVAPLRGLWTITPWAEGHTRLVVNKLKTQDWKTFFKHLPHRLYIKDMCELRIHPVRIYVIHVNDT